MNAEISAVGVNPAAGPTLEIWGWEVVAYLFLGGLAAGLLILSGSAHRRREAPPVSLALWAPLLAPVLLAVGGLALFLDLEQKLHVFRFYTAFRPASPMWWGSWILAFAFPVSALSALAAVLETGAFAAGGGDSASRRLLCAIAAKAAAAGLSVEAVARKLAPANIALGTALGIYTGILLGAFGARPLWNTPLLGPLFLLSGLSGAAAVLALVEPDPDARQRLGSLDLKLIAAEAAVLALILIGLATGGEAQGSAARLLLGGEFTALFWVAVVFAGLALPALLEWMHRAGRAQATAYVPVLVLFGGLLLRAVILLAGQASRWESL